MLPIAVAKHGAEFTIRIQVTPSIPHLAFNVQQFVFTAVQIKIPVVAVGFGADGVSVCQRELIILWGKSAFRHKQGVILRPPVPITLFMGDVFSAH